MVTAALAAPLPRTVDRGFVYLFEYPVEPDIAAGRLVRLLEA